MPDATCSVATCDRPVHVKLRGLCLAHYLRWRRHGDPEGGRRSWGNGKPPFKSRPCSMEGCNIGSQSLGYCRLHYERVHANGTPELAPRPTLEQRFWALVNRDGECWPWLGVKVKGTGYGSFRNDGRTNSAHRWAYELAIGPVPEGLVLDHLCHKPDGSCPGGAVCPHRLCVRPDHLKAVTQSENVRRGLLRSKTTHCPQGHPYEGYNLITLPSRGGTSRTCRLCKQASERRRRARRKDA